MFRAKIKIFSNFASMRQFFFLFIVFVCAACGTKQPARELKFELPQVPAMMIKPQELMTAEDSAEIRRYMAMHYWDKMPFTDTAYINKEVTLQAFSDYAYMLVNLPLELAKESVYKTMDKARADSAMYAYFAKMADDHFHSAESFYYRNDDIYMSVLDNILAWEGADELHKIRPRAQRELIMRNRVGHTAADFPITLANGSVINMHDIRADYLLIYFNQPSCPICAVMTEDIVESPLLGRLIASGRMKVVAVYPGLDIASWRVHTADMPATWTQGYAEGMRDADTYDLRALPSLYLLDKNKNVLVKDGAQTAQVEQYLEQH
jgi:hypothetical protein